MIKIIFGAAAIFASFESSGKKVVFGENIVSIHKDKKYNTWIHDAKELKSQIIKLHKLKSKNSKKWVSRIIIEVNNSEKEIKYISSAIRAANKLNGSIIISFSWWLRFDEYENFKAAASYSEINLGINSAVSGIEYGRIRNSKIIGVLEKIKNTIGNKMWKETIWGVDIRNESAFVDFEDQLDGNKFNDIRESAIFVGYSLVKSLKKQFPGLRTIASTYCPLTVGRERSFGRSRSNSKLQPFDISTLRAMNVDVIDIHIYPGGWAGKNSGENINTCFDNKNKYNMLGDYIIGETGYVEKYWKNDSSDINDEIKSLKNMYQIIGCPKLVISWDKYVENDDDNKLLDGEFTKKVHENALKDGCHNNSVK